LLFYLISFISFYSDHLFPMFIYQIECLVLEHLHQHKLVIGVQHLQSSQVQDKSKMIQEVNLHNICLYYILSLGSFFLLNP